MHFRACSLSRKVLSALYQMRVARRRSIDILLEKKQAYATLSKKALKGRADKGPFIRASFPMSSSLLEKMGKWEL